MSNIKKLEEQVKDLKNNSVAGLLSYIHSIRQMDSHSKKMVYKRFEPQVLNSFSRTATIVEKRVDEMTLDTVRNHKVDLNSDQLESVTSGNDSSNDEMNQIATIRSKLISKKVAVSDNSSDSFIDALQDEINHQDDQRDD